MYPPKEDSYFLAEVLSAYLRKLSKAEKEKLTALDLGCGSGIQAETLSKFIKKQNILCSDIDKEALKFVKNKKFKAINSNLFSKIKSKFNLIVFNPPYLPQDTYDKEKDTTGGKKGDETILKFLQQAGKHLKTKGKIFLLFSSLTPKTRIMNEIKKQNLIIEKTYEKKLFFEQLYIAIISSS